MAVKLIVKEKVIVTNSRVNPPTHIKAKINKLARLLKKIKYNNAAITQTRHEIKSLNKEVKQFFHNVTTKQVRRGIKPGNSKTLWNAVKLAKDCNLNTLPDTLFLNNAKITIKTKLWPLQTFFKQSQNYCIAIRNKQQCIFRIGQNQHTPITVHVGSPNSRVPKGNQSKEL